MKTKIISKLDFQKIDLQKTYVERLERFMALIELSYALKHSPKVIQKK